MQILSVNTVTPHRHHLSYIEISRHTHSHFQITTCQKKNKNFQMEMWREVRERLKTDIIHRSTRDKVSF